MWCVGWSSVSPLRAEQLVLEAFCSVVIWDGNINAYSVVFVGALHCKILPLINTPIVLEEETEFLLGAAESSRRSLGWSTLIRSLLTKLH